MALNRMLIAQILRDGARFETQAKGDLRLRCRTWEDLRRVVHTKTSGCKLSGKKHTTVSSDPTVPNNSIMDGNLRDTNPFFFF